MEMTGSPSVAPQEDDISMPGVDSPENHLQAQQEDPGRAQWGGDTSRGRSAVWSQACEHPSPLQGKPLEAGKRVGGGDGAAGRECRQRVANTVVGQQRRRVHTVPAGAWRLQRSLACQQAYLYTSVWLRA